MSQTPRGAGVAVVCRRAALSSGALALLLLPWGSSERHADARPMRLLPSSAALARSSFSGRALPSAAEPSPVPREAPPPPPLARCGSYRPAVEGALQLRTAYRGPGKSTFKFCPRWSSFGPVRGRVHGGIDVTAVTGALVYAATDGIVDYARDPGGYGLFARLHFREDKATPTGCTPGAEISVIYAHLLDDSKTAHASRVVRAGDVLGRVGCSGNAKGMCSPSPESHVHVTVERGPARQRIDPAAFLGWKVHVPEDAPPGMTPCR